MQAPITTLPLFQRHLSPQTFEKLIALKEKTLAHPFAQKFTTNWKTLLMDASTVVCITGLVIAMISGSGAIGAAFFLASCASGVGSFYMRQFAALKALETTVDQLKKSLQDVETQAQKFEKENGILSRTSQELREQVTELGDTVTRLEEAEQNFRTENARYQQENTTLAENVRNLEGTRRGLEGQLAQARTLTQEISQSLGIQTTELTAQLEELRTVLESLRGNNEIFGTRLRDLQLLCTTITQKVQELNEINLAYEATRARFEAIQEALEQVRIQFEQTLGQQAQAYQSNNTALGNHINTLAQEVTRIGSAINHRPPFHASPNQSSLPSINLTAISQKPLLPVNLAATN